MAEDLTWTPADPLIRLDGVTVAYRDRPALLSEVSLDIRAGELVAITGPTGSGKTVLMNLLLGLERPNAGRVLLAGRAPRSPGGPTVAYVPQHAALFDGTLEENLLLFGEAGRDRLPAITQALGLDQVAGRLRSGLNTQVGNALSETLPQGVVQRVAIARALLSDPDILLFDAANAALDAEGDDAVRRLLAVEKTRRTVVIVSLRPSLLRLADRIMVLDGGRLSQRVTVTEAAE